MRLQKQDNTLDRIRGGLTLGAVALMSLVFLPWAYSPFIWPKMFWGQAMAAGLGALALGGALTGRPLVLRIHRTQLLFWAFLLWNFLMVPVASSPGLARDRALWLGACGVLAWAWQEWGWRSRKRILRALWLLVFTAGITAVWALLQDMQAKWTAVWPEWLPRIAVAENKLGDWRGYVTAGLGNTDFIAALLATLYLPILLFFFHVRGFWRIAILLVALWLCAAALVVCWSVGGNGALILSSILVLLGLGRKRLGWVWRHRRGRLVVWLAGCLLAIVWLVTDTPLNPHRPGIFQEAFGSERWEEGGPTRAVIWLNTFELIRQNQIKGVGPGCFPFWYPRVQSPFLPDDPNWLRYQGAYTNSAHNTILETWAELGPIGALLLVWMVWSAFAALGRVARRARGWKKPFDAWVAWGAIGALSAWCLDSMMTFPLLLPDLTLLFCCLLPLGALLDRGDPEGRGAFVLPSVTFERGWLRGSVESRDMRQIEALRFWLEGPRWGAGIGIFGIIVLAGFCAWFSGRPVVSDVRYKQAREREEARDRALTQGDKTRAAALDAEADALYRTALTLWPDHHDCRSAYTRYLLDAKRYEECLDNLARVFERLDSWELYERHRNACVGLGLQMEAQRDNRIILKRMAKAFRSAELLQSGKRPQ